MKSELSRWVPPGLNARQELQWIAAGLLLSTLWSLSFFLSLRSAWASLYREGLNGRELIPDAQMADFADVMGRSLAGFGIMACCLLALAVWHYASHYQGGRSIYLMRRLPSRWELHRRCLALPLAAALVCGLTALTLLLVYFAAYLAVTPEECLTPGQWARLWAAILPGGAT